MRSPGGRRFGRSALQDTTIHAPSLTATAQASYGRVLLRLQWPFVASATIVRVDPDGATSPVRNVEPGLVASVWVGYDHEAPLDAAVTYRATTTDPSGAGIAVTSEATTVDSGGRAWLKHPGKPGLNRRVKVRENGKRQAPARRGVHRPTDRPDPVVISQPRQSDSRVVVLQTDGTWADQTALDELLADGAVLLLQTPAAWGGESLYASVDTADVEPLDVLNGTMWERRYTLPYDVTKRPPGAATGAYGVTCADVLSAYLTCAALLAGEATCADLATQPGP